MSSFVRWGEINDILEWADAEYLIDDNHNAVREKLIRKLLNHQELVTKQAVSQRDREIFQRLKNASPLAVSRDAFDDHLTCNITPYIIERYEKIILK